MFSVVYIISRDMEEAGRIADVLVAERLVACVNFGIISSVYRWEGRIQRDTEVSMLCKTTTERVLDVIKRVKEIHSYELPCITSWKLEDGYGPYLEWVKAETEKGR
ncbi:CutA homolog [Methanocella paludicola SANAE]|uniref:CutA homolog n=1 Tax=Methanocella paludicola (strain DSM 17711 / JCM 13418 / NBRC 101707 / SANAE) TaxID=304371 RepID=D1YUN7_METPS|nr:divalent-cation tolerance protein CutA [Methanocella paludicola]BAI60159.1 CutA homolog [Methanocella paludicola SANAE]